MIPVDLFHTVYKDGSKIDCGQFDVQLGEHGEIIAVIINGVHVKGEVRVEELAAALLGQKYLMEEYNKALEKHQIRIDEITAFKKQRDLELERMA